MSGEDDTQVPLELRGSRVEDSLAEAFRLDDELRQLKEKGMGQEHPRIAGVYRPSTRAEGSTEPYVIVVWDKGRVKVMSERYLTGASEQNLTSAHARGDGVTEVPFKVLTPYRIVDVGNVSQGRDGMIKVDIKTEDGDRQEVLVTVDEYDILHAFVHPASFVERYGDAPGQGVQEHLESSQKTLVVPDASGEPDDGIVLVPDPFSDTVSDPNTATFTQLAHTIAGALITADVLSGRGGSYFQQALRPLDISFMRRKALDKAIDILQSKATLTGDQIVFNGIMGVLNRSSLLSALGITELTIEGVRHALAQLVTEELKNASPEQLKQLLDSMYTLADSRRLQRNQQ